MQINVLSVQHADGWCAVAEGENPREGDANVKTRCGMYVVMPYGLAMREPTCPDCFIAAVREMWSSAVYLWMEAVRKNDKDIKMDVARLIAKLPPSEAVLCGADLCIATGIDSVRELTKLIEEER